MFKHSVGLKGVNNARDIIILQRLLNTRTYTSPHLLGPVQPSTMSKKHIAVDGLYGPTTQATLDRAVGDLWFPPTLPYNGTVKPYDWVAKALWPTVFANPTGLGIRGSDNYGSGHHGASRGSRTHDGVDYIAKANQKVLAPLSGLVTKISKPYSSGIDAAILSGIEIVSSDGHRCWLWYMEPAANIVGSLVIAGVSVVGKMKTLTNRYTNGITDHVHLRIHNRYNVTVNPSKVIK